MAYTRIVFVPNSLRSGMSLVHPAESARGSVNVPVVEVVPFELTSC